LSEFVQLLHKIITELLMKIREKNSVSMQLSHNFNIYQYMQF